MSLLDRAAKAVTFLAENSGVITLNTQRAIEGKADPIWALQRIKEETFNVKDGENTREIITHITQPTRTQYTPILGAGNQTLSVINPQTGVAESVSGDQVGRGCSLPADTMQFGYDVRTSCLKARAVEIGPFCVLDLIRKNAHKEVINRLWAETPPILKSQFARQLLREVITLGKFKFSAAEGVPFVTDTPGFPCPATGGPDIGVIRRIANMVKPWGWNEGADTPMMDGQRLFQVYMGGDAVEWAIETRKNQKGFKIETLRTTDDKVFGQTTVYEGIQFIREDRPLRVVMLQTGASTYELVEVEPTKVVPAEGEGFKEVPNEDYEQDFITLSGQRLRVFEVGFWIHPMALVRESMGALPSMPGGKSFNRRFDFSVKPIEDWELAAKGCNKDLFFFGYRALHAFAIKRRKHELCGAFLYIAPKPRYDIIVPWSSDEAAEAAATTLQDLAKPPVATCEPCVRPDNSAREPVMPDCTTLFPENGVGVITLKQTAYDVSEDVSGVTIVVERQGGNVGAASCVVTITEGTATSPENYGTPTGFATPSGSTKTKTLNWADEVEGKVSFVIPMVGAVGDDAGKQFTISIGTFSGAVAGAITSATVTILDADGE